MPHVDQYDVVGRIQDYCSEFKTARAFEQAEPCYKRAVEICIEERTEISECGFMLFNELGEVYAGAGVLSDAKSAFDTSIGIAQKLGTPYFEAGMLSNAGKSYSSMEQYEVAEQHLLNALAITEQKDFYENSPEDTTQSNLHMMRVLIHANLANNYAQVGNSSAAMSHIEKARRICNESNPDEEMCYFILSLVPVVLAKSEGKDEESSYKLYKAMTDLALKSGAGIDEVKQMTVNVNPEIAAKIFDPNSLPEPRQGDYDWYRTWWLSSDEVEIPAN
jgi:tetratricopeptide (TPR) repeat protein